MQNPNLLLNPIIKFIYCRDACSSLLKRIKKELVTQYEYYNIEQQKQKLKLKKLSSTGQNFIEIGKIEDKIYEIQIDRFNLYIDFCTSILAEYRDDIISLELENNDINFINEINLLTANHDSIGYIRYIRGDHKGIRFPKFIDIPTIENNGCSLFLFITFHEKTKYILNNKVYIIIYYNQFGQVEEVFYPANLFSKSIYNYSLDLDTIINLDIRSEILNEYLYFTCKDDRDAPLPLTVGQLITLYKESLSTKGLI